MDAGRGKTDPPESQWWQALPPAEATILCGEREHVVRWADGSLTLPAHPDAEAELVLGALGGRSAECVELAQMWGRHTDDLDVLALGPRSAADRVMSGWNDLDWTGPAGPIGPPGPAGPIGPPGPAGPAAAPGTGRTRRASPQRVVTARMVPMILRASANPFGMAALGSSGQAGGLTFFAQPPQEPDPRWAGRIELLYLFALGPPFQLRLAGAVAASLNGQTGAAHRPRLAAALTGRLAPAAGEWLGIDPDRVTATVHEGPGWGSVELTGTGDARSLRASLPVSWLASVWACGLAVAGGHLVVAVRTARWPDAEVLALPEPGAEPTVLRLRGSLPPAKAGEDREARENREDGEAGEPDHGPRWAVLAARPERHPAASSRAETQPAAHGDGQTSPSRPEQFSTAGGDGEADTAWTVDPEAAESYLRLLAEAELRQAVRPEWHRRREYPGSLRYTAAALATVGAIGGPVADTVVSDMNAALALRDPGGPSGVAVHRLRPTPVRPNVVLAGPAPLPAATGRLPAAPARPFGSFSAALAGQMFRLHDEDTAANLWVLSVVRTPDSTWCAVGAMLQGRPRHMPYGLRVPRLRALDDRGGHYGVHFSGYSSETTASGWLSIHPAVPDDVRWIEFYSHLNTPRLRLDLAAGPTPAQVTVDPAAPASPGERLLDAIATDMLTREASLGGSLDTIVAALTAARALPPGSLAPSRLAVLCQRALLDAGPGLVAALEAGDLPAATLPEPWTGVLAHSVRRHKPAVRPGVAPLAVVLPELDGIRFVLAGLRSEASHSLLSVAAQGLPQDDHGHGLGFQWSQWFPWWIRDSAGQWHAAMAGGHDPGGQDLAPLHLRVVPPLPRAVTRMDVVISGRTARVTATVPVVWVAG